jgi:hypothetical protein
MSLKWNGDEIERKMLAAQKFGIDQTMAACVVDAKSNYYPGHGFVTGVLQGSIQMRQAKHRGDRVVGLWGSFDVDYALSIEKGSGLMPGQGQLQNAADSEYPKLASRIRASFKA